jgi:hypothetical protein
LVRSLTLANPLSQSNMAEDFGGITCVCSNTSPVMMLCNATATAASEQMQCCRPTCGSRFPTARDMPRFARVYTSSRFVANEEAARFSNRLPRLLTHQEAHRRCKSGVRALPRWGAGAVQGRQIAPCSSRAHSLFRSDRFSTQEIALHLKVPSKGGLMAPKSS